MIVQRLREIQNRLGFLPDEELRKLAQDAGIPLYQIEEVSSYFPAFRLGRTNPPTIAVRVCRDITCHLRGATDLLNEETGLPLVAAKVHQETDPAKRNEVCIEGVSCLGRCDRAPAVWVERHPMPPGVHAWVYAGKSREELNEIVIKLVKGETLPDPDDDANYQPATNADRLYIVPTEPHAASHRPLPSATWTIDVYNGQGWPRDYRAVQAFVKELTDIRRKCIPRPTQNNGQELQGKDLEQYVQKNHPKLWELKLSGLLGMGGAGAPAYQKWLDVWRERSDYETDQPEGPLRPISNVKKQSFEKYIVANGDESEPGTFKDRELLLRLPHLVVEGVILAGLMTGATAGYIFIRHEYHEQIHAIRDEIARAKALGACGVDVFGCGRGFPVEVFESPGGYICGEQSALLEAMEDRRAQPRNRPPELNSNGLRDRPTVVNNIETLAWIPAIVLRGGAEYAAGGWRLQNAVKPLGFGGRRLFSVSGDVRRPGVYEVPIGLPMRELLEDPRYCGGVTGAGLKAVATSGPSGGLLPARIPIDLKLRDTFPEAVKKLRERSNIDADLMEWFLLTHLPEGSTHLDLQAVPLDLNFYRNLHGVLRFPVEPMLGAGLVVYAEGRDALDIAVNFTEFYRNESCGKCVPCRLGSQKLVQIGSGLLGLREAGTPPVGEDAKGLQADVKELTKVLQLTSICGLGYVAPIPLATTIAYFPADLLTKSSG
ncbi:MAG TPA: NAD(P)H-dependent oxidoreductase subunit E [Gemmata sp.]|nr:NAD(P)H-dependent oxidoreductase subunit E [Gemmata sp.]